jgi:hypothetical protein
VAAKADDIVGVWLLRWSAAAGYKNEPVDFTIKNDGTYSIDDTAQDQHIERGTFSFKGGNLVLDSDECYESLKAIFFHCIGIYTVYSTKQGEMPVRLRFVAVDDAKKGDRYSNLNSKTLQLTRLLPPQPTGEFH